jgi:hypothetical protein
MGIPAYFILHARLAEPVSSEKRLACGQLSFLV